MALSGMRGLSVFISDVRNSQNKDQERVRVDKELGNIRTRFKNEKSKTFDFVEGDDAAKVAVKIFERGRGFFTEIWLDQVAGWRLEQFIVECISARAEKYRVDHLPCSRGKILVEKNRNGRGAFIALSLFPFSGGRRRWIIFPEGRLRDGWRWIAEALRSVLPIRSSPSRLLHRGSELQPLSGPCWPSLSCRDVGYAPANELSVPLATRAPLLDPDQSWPARWWNLALVCIFSKPWGSWEALEKSVNDILPRDEQSKLVPLGASKGIIVVKKLSTVRELSACDPWPLPNGGSFSLNRWWPRVNGVQSVDLRACFWLEIVGLPFHLWKSEIFSLIGDACGGFLRVDHRTLGLLDLSVARIQVVETRLQCIPRTIEIPDGGRMVSVAVFVSPVADPPVSGGTLSGRPSFRGKEDSQKFEFQITAGKPVKEANQLPHFQPWLAVGAGGQVCQSSGAVSLVENSPQAGAPAVECGRRNGQGRQVWGRARRGGTRFWFRGLRGRLVLRRARPISAKGRSVGGVGCGDLHVGAFREVGPQVGVAPLCPGPNPVGPSGVVQQGVLGLTLRSGPNGDLASSPLSEDPFGLYPILNRLGTFKQGPDPKSGASLSSSRPVGDGVELSSKGLAASGRLSSSSKSSFVLKRLEDSRWFRFGSPNYGFVGDSSSVESRVPCSSLLSGKELSKWSGRGRASESGEDHIAGLEQSDLLSPDLGCSSRGQGLYGDGDVDRHYSEEVDLSAIDSTMVLQSPGSDHIKSSHEFLVEEPPDPMREPVVAGSPSWDASLGRASMAGLEAWSAGVGSVSGSSHSVQGSSVDPGDAAGVEALWTSVTVEGGKVGCDSGTACELEAKTVSPLRRGLGAASSVSEPQFPSVGGQADLEGVVASMVEFGKGLGMSFEGREAEVCEIFRTLVRGASKGLTPYEKKKYVWKMLYIYMLGYDVDFGHMEAVSLISAPKYPEKQVPLLLELLMCEDALVCDCMVGRKGIEGFSRQRSLLLCINGIYPLIHKLGYHCPNRSKASQRQELVDEPGFELDSAFSVSSVSSPLRSEGLRQTRGRSDTSLQLGRIVLSCGSEEDHNQDATIGTSEVSGGEGRPGDAKVPSPGGLEMEPIALRSPHEEPEGGLGDEAVPVTEGLVPNPFFGC
ncbi:hypothetical protein HHK36_011298 [Tetracentron sinense]|uniref:DUF4283 domain-containing protein n=1 Tax=Tetracentron sinense TaxID=13715 RepID=A0A834Z8Z7_TETSI|nr:hypothetical protein HHK36_011298 [Tetracentron sinense]